MEVVDGVAANVGKKGVAVVEGWWKGRQEEMRMIVGTQTTSPHPSLTHRSSDHLGRNAEPNHTHNRPDDAPLH